MFTSNRKDNLRRHQKKNHPALILSCRDEYDDKTNLQDQQCNLLSTTQLYNVSNFMRVAASGDLDRLETFLDAGLKIEARAEDESTILHCAARAGQAAAVDHLLTKGASVNVRNDKGRLPIHEAVLSNSPETLKCFLESMTQESLCASKREVERYLARSGNASMIDAYITRLGNDCSDWDVSTKLSFAVRAGHYSLVTTLLDDSNVDVNRKFHGHSLNFAPIHLAALLGRTKIMERLVACDRIDIDLRDSLSRHSLHIAASKGHTAIVKQLLGHSNVDVNSQDIGGATPLHCAAYDGQIIVVAQLIRYAGVDINCQDKKGATPLHYAAASGRWEMISFLLRCWDLVNDDQCLPPDDPSTSVSFAKEDLIRRLLKHPGFVNPNQELPRDKTLLEVAATKGDFEAIKVLLAYPDIDVNICMGYCGRSPLMNAARNGKLEAARLLLQHKEIDVNLRVRGGFWAALTYAKLHKHYDIVDLLLSHGAIDHDAKAPSTVPTTAHIDNSQITTFQPDHDTHFDQFDDDMDGAPTEAWEGFLAMEEGMEE